MGKIKFLMAVTMMLGFAIAEAQPSSCDNDPLARPMITATNNGVICNGNSITLTVTSQPGGPLPSWFNIQWYLNGSPIPGGTTRNITVSSTGVYTVKASNSECMSTTQYSSGPFTVSSSPASTASITGTLKVPPGGTTTLTANPAGLTYSWNTGQSSQSITVGAGTYTVTVTDANGCSNSVSATVTEDPACAPSVSVTNGGVVCNGAPVTLSLTNLSDGTGFQWYKDGTAISGANSTTYSATAAGAYTIQVTSPSCGTVTSSPATVSTSSISASISGNTSIPTGGTTTLTAQPSGASSYSWSNGATSQSITVGAGSYSVTVTNAQGCSSTANTNVTVDAACTPTISASNGGVICNGGSITLSVGNASNFSDFQWQLNGANIGGATGATYSATAPGSYSVVATGSCGAVTSSAITVTTSSVSASISGNTTVPTGGTTTLTAQPSGMTYTWSNGATSQSITVGAGTYSVTVTNAQGCSSTANATVNENVGCTPSVNASNGGIICNGGSITLSLSNASSFSAFQWQLNGANIAGATSSTYSATAAGSYTVVATGSCGSVTSSPINVTASSVSASITGNTTVPTGGTTTLTAQPSGMTYSWSNGATSQSITVGAGSYTVTVTNTQGCTSSANATVSENSSCTPLIQVTNNGVICNSGSVTISVSNAVNFTSFQWRLNGSNMAGATASTYVTSVPGDYSVVATSASCGSATSTSVAVTTSTINASITGNTNVSTGGTTVLTAQPAGMTYSWSNGATTQSITVGAGSYTVTVTNAQGCSSTANATVTENTSCIPIVQASNNGVICNGASIILSVSNASSFSKFKWQLNGVDINGATASTYTTNTAGTYTAYDSSDVCGWVASSSINVTASSLTAAITGNTSIPTGGTTTLTAQPSGMTYSWSNGATSQSITVGAGTYSVTVTNSQGCSSTANTTVVETGSCSPVVQATNNGVICNGGSITLSVSNASSFTKFQWELNGTNISGANSNTYTTSVPGTYAAYDSSGTCGWVKSSQFTVTSSSVSASISGNTTVATGGTTTLTAQPSGMTYAWSNGATSQSITVGAGSYTVTVTNTQGCTSSANATVSENAGCTPSVNASNGGVICNGGSITLSLTNASSFTSFQWQLNGANIAGATSSTYSATAAGSYTVVATGSCGAVTSSPINVTASSVSASITGNTTVPTGGTTTLTAQPSGMTYSWSNGSTSQSITVGVGSYSVTVTNTQGCNSTANTTVSENAGCSPAVSVSNGGVACNGGSVSLSLTNLTDATSWQWFKDGVSISGATTTAYSASAAGDYTIQVTSPSCGTVTSSPVAVSTSSITASITGNTVVPSGGTTTLTAQPSGASSYSWSNGATSQSVTVGAGSYSVTVTNTQGCSSTTSTTVTTNSCNLTASIKATSNGGGSITLTASPDGMTYQWSEGQTTQSITETPTASKTYTVVVTNSNNCSSTATYTFNYNGGSSGKHIIKASGSTSFCEGNSIVLTGPAGYDSYYWEPSKSTTQSISISPSVGNYVYGLTAINATTIEYDTIHVEVFPKPTAGIDAIQNNDGSWTLTAKPQGLKYLWSNGATTNSITVTNQSTYTVTVTNNNGCSSQASYQVVGCTTSAPNITNTGGTAICGKDTIKLSATSASSGNWQWYKDGNAIANETNNTYDATAPGKYSVDLIASCGSKMSNIISITQGTGLTGDFSISPNPVDFGGLAELSANVNGASVYNWSFGDGDVANNSSMTVKHYYYTPGILTIKLTAISSEGCKLDLQKTIEVKTDNSATPPTTIDGDYKLNIFPSPYHDRLYITFKLKKDSKVVVHVVNPAGGVIKKIELSGKMGNNKFQLLGMEALNSNVTYLFKVFIEGKIYHDKILKY